MRYLLNIFAAAGLILVAIAIGLVALPSHASGYHHHNPNVTVNVPEPTVIDNSTHTVEIIEQTIDNTVTVQETIDNTVTEEYYNTEVIDQTVYQTNVEQYENTFDDSRLSQGIAMVGAMGNIPSLSNKSSKNTGVGVGIGVYNGEEAFALGLVHHTNDLALKASLGFTADDSMFGAGATFGF